MLWRASQQWVLRARRLFATAAIALAATSFLTAGAGAQTGSEAAPASGDQAAAAAAAGAGVPYTVAIIASSDRDGCFTPGTVAATRYLTDQRAAEINAASGIAGRRLELIHADDFETEEKTIAVVDEALQDPNLVGIIGIDSSTRGKAVIDRIAAAGMPLISGMSRGDVFAGHAGAFSLSVAVSDEIAVTRKFIESHGFQRPAFVGFAGDLYAEEYSQALIAAAGPAARIHWIPTNNYRLDEVAADEVIAQIKAQNADIVFLAIHSGPGGGFLRRMRDQGFEVPAFVALGRIARIQGLMGEKPYGQDMYELAREGVPHVFNERLQQRIWKHGNARWIFDDVRASDRPADCDKYVDPDKITDVRSQKNSRALGRGIQAADALAMLAEAAGSVPHDGGAKGLRQRIALGLGRLREGERVSRGAWQDWSFTPGRSVAQDALLVYRRGGESSITLAPQQYRRTPFGLEPVPVVYIAVDVVRIFQVDSNEKTFSAEFYLSFRSNDGIDLADIEFTNAFRSPVSNESVISARKVHSEASGEFGSARPLQLYKVTGKFLFDPDLTNYPFDKQKFSISFQPANTSRTFFIQPPSRELRRMDFDIDGWAARLQYVGADQDIIAVVGDRENQQTIIPLNKFNYSWVMKRLATDYYLQVLIPLVVILIVTWLSVFIAEDRLESVVAIQVTALLSSIALYLAVPKVEFDHATISDIIFVTTYLAITLMLGLSILRTNIASRRRGTPSLLGRIAKGFQMVALPLVMLAMLSYVVARDAEAGASPLAVFWEHAKPIF